MLFHTFIRGLQIVAAGGLATSPLSRLRSYKLEPEHWRQVSATGITVNLDHSIASLLLGPIMGAFCLAQILLHLQQSGKQMVLKGQ